MRSRITAFALSIVLSTPALAQAPVELSVYMPQGVVRAVESHIVPIMRDRYNTKVVITPSLSGQALTKAVAQRSNPEISVFLLDEGPWLQGKQAGLWDTLDGVASLSQIPARFRDRDNQGSAFLLYLLGSTKKGRTIATESWRLPRKFMPLSAILIFIYQQRRYP